MAKLKRNEILDHRALPDLYARHRRCVIKRHDGRLEEIADAARITLGFEKARLLVEAAEIQPSHIVTALFAGPGGIVRLASLCRPRLLFAIDKLYAGPKPTPDGWHYPLAEQFEGWVQSVESAGVVRRADLRPPIVCQGDVATADDRLAAAVDRVLVDPPFGNISRRVEGLGETESRHVFSEGIRCAQRLLADGGTIVSIIPTSWLETLSEMRSLSHRIVTRVGRRVSLAIVETCNI